MRGARYPDRSHPSPCPSPEREREPAPDPFRAAQETRRHHLSRSGEVESASADRVRVTGSSGEVAPLTLSLSRTGEGTRDRSFQGGTGGAPPSPLPFGRGRVGEADRVRGARYPDEPEPLTLSLSRTGEGTRANDFRVEPYEGASPHLSRSGEVESATADRVRGATSPDIAQPPPQPPPERERGPASRRSACRHPAVARQNRSLMNSSASGAGSRPAASRRSIGTTSSASLATR